MPFVATDPNSTSPTDRVIALAQQKLQRDSNDLVARVELAQAFLQKAREVADPSLYSKADGLVDGVVKKDPKNVDAWVTRGTVALAQHRFRDAEKDGKKAIDLVPEHQPSYSVLVDASNELGKSDDALRYTQTMLDLKPNLPALSRASYARELRGDIDGAIGAMGQAITAGGSAGGENVAYVQTLLGGLLLTKGDVRGAEAAYDNALADFPGFGAAQAGKARVAVARNNPNAAADILNDLVRRQPLPEHAMVQADALAAAGRTVEAADAYGLVDVISRLYESSGVNVDREMALFEADHRPTKQTVEDARDALEERPSPASHDVLAWALFKTGKAKEAAEESDKALALGSREPQERFHAAAIAHANGDLPKATLNMQMVLSSNPRFSAAHIQQVEMLAAQLGLMVPPPPS